MRTGGKGATTPHGPPAAPAPQPPRFDLRRFTPELTPSWLHLVTLLAGHRPPAPHGHRGAPGPAAPGPTHGWRVAYLGGGHGFTAAVTAAVHPDTDVWWWDPGLAATEAARTLRDTADLANLTVHEHPDVAADLGGGPRDLVVIDGVLDAVDDDLRTAVIGAATTALRPGGLLCIAYRTEVGWGEVAPVHHLLRHLVARDPRPAQQSVPEALAAVDGLRAGGAQYLVERPVVAAWWQELSALPIADVSDQLRRGPLRALSHAQVVRAVGPGGFSYVGPARPDDLGPPPLPAELVELIDRNPAPLVREALTDLALRRSHRCDVFRLGSHLLTDRERHRAVDALAVTGVGRLDPTDPTLRRVLPAAARRSLAAGSMSVADLADAASDREALLRSLLGRGLVHPVSSPATEPTEAGADPTGAGDPRATAAAKRLSAVTGRAPVPAADRIRVAPALGSALPASADLPADQRRALGMR